MLKRSEKQLVWLTPKGKPKCILAGKRGIIFPSDMENAATAEELPIALALQKDQHHIQTA